VDFEVFPGECFGFLGPNGAGKTSTMKMIYAAAVPTGGELSVESLPDQGATFRVLLPAASVAAAAARSSAVA